MSDDTKTESDGQSMLEKRAEEALRDPAARKAAAGFIRRQFDKLSFKWKAIILGGGAILVYALLSTVIGWLIYIGYAVVVIALIYGLKLIFTGSPKIKS
jgi:hypothetical protein